LYEMCNVMDDIHTTSESSCSNHERSGLIVVNVGTYKMTNML